MADMEKVVKGWAMSCINSYLKGDGDTTVVFSADECAQSLGYENAQSDEAREAIHEALKALISISITYQERDGEDIDYHGSAFATASRLADEWVYIDLVEDVVSLFKLLEV